MIMFSLPFLQGEKLCLNADSSNVHLRLKWGSWPTHFQTEFNRQKTESTFVHGIVCRTSNSGPFLEKFDLFCIEKTNRDLNIEAEKVNCGVAEGKEESVERETLHLHRLCPIQSSINNPLREGKVAVRTSFHGLFQSNSF